MSFKNGVFVILLCCTHFLWGQDATFRFRNFGIKEGLSQSSAFSIFQDRKGFLWISTTDGLNQFDGYTFTVYKNNHLDANSLSDSWVTAILLEDSDNELWLLTADRTINKFNLRTKEVTRFTFGKYEATAPQFDQLYHIREDRHKNIWFSTNLGICRYHKPTKRFINYFKNRNCPSYLTGNFATYIFEDNQGYLWFSTYKGLYRYNVTTDTFELFDHTPNACGRLISDKIIWMGEDSTHNFWALTSRGLCRFDYKSQSFVSYPFPVSEEIQDFRSAFLSTRIDKKGTIWIGTGFGLFRFEPEFEQYFPYRHTPFQPGSISDNKISFLFENKKGEIWIGTSDGLNKYNRTDNNFEQFNRQGNVSDEHFISQIVEDKNGEIWVLGKNDLSRGASLGRLNKKNREIEWITNDRCNPNSIPSSFVYHPYIDRTGNIWFASFGDGLIQYVPQNSKFENYSFVQGNHHSLGGNSIWGFAEDKEGSIWIPLFNNGIDKFDTCTKQFTHFVPQHKSINKAYSIFSITKGRNDDMWCSTVGGGVLYLNTQTGKIKQYLHHTNYPGSISSNFMRSILPDGSGKIWIGHAAEGLDLFDPSTETATHFKNNPSNKNSLASNNIWCLLLDRNKELWISCDGYIDRYNPSTGKFIHYKSKVSDFTGIIADKALCIYEDTKGFIWFGTSGGGLSVFDRATGKFRHWTEAEGLPNNVIYGILEDNNGMLWLSTNKGLSKFDVKNNTFTNYDTNNGLQSNEFNMGSCFKSSTGKLYFGGINGFNAFYPQHIIPDAIKVNTVITGFQIFNKDVPVIPASKRNLIDKRSPTKVIRNNNTFYLPLNISYTNEVILTYREKVFTIEYAALFFNSPEKVTYRYMMENFDVDWNNAGTRRFATYTNLPAGEYIFKVMAANPDGIWNPVATRLKIRILPPFWQTLWFFILEIIFACCALMLIIRLRVMNLKQAKKRLEEQVKERTQKIREKNDELELRNIQIMKQKEEIAFQAQQLKTELVIQNQMSEMALLRSQINPHFLFNTLNNVYSLVYQQAVEAPEAVMKLSELMRYMLYEASSEKVLLQNEISYLKSYIALQLLRIKNKNFVSFIITGNTNGRMISPMLLISFVENAFKHGIKKGINPGIRINLEITDNRLTFEAVNYTRKNNWINKDKTGGIGLTNVKRRLELLYHNKFKLDIRHADEMYHVKLELEE